MRWKKLNFMSTSSDPARTLPRTSRECSARTGRQEKQGGSAREWVSCRRRSTPGTRPPLSARTTTATDPPLAPLPLVEERDQLVGVCRSVGAAELDQVIGVAAVEVEVGEEVGLAGDAADGVAQGGVGEPGANPRRLAVM